MSKKVDFTKKGKKVDFSKKTSSEKKRIDEILKPVKGEIREVIDDVTSYGVGGAKISEKGVESIGSEKASELIKEYGEKRELTAREQAMRDKDCKVEYSKLVPERMHKGLDESRRANWIPPTEVEKMPQWTPVLQPVVDAVIEENVKEVALFMDTVMRGDKEKVVQKLIPKVLKKLPGHAVDLVEKRLWDTLYALMREQGVSNKHSIGKVLS